MNKILKNLLNEEQKSAFLDLDALTKCFKNLNIPINEHTLRTFHDGFMNGVIMCSENKQQAEHYTSHLNEYLKKGYYKQYMQLNEQNNHSRQ